MIKVKKNSLALLALLLCFLQNFAQSKTSAKKDFIISTAGHYGFIIAHHDYLDYLIQSHIGGVEINFIKPTYGDKQWQQVYRYPEIGISYLHAWLGNPAELGNLEGIMPFINFPVSKGEKFQLHLKVGSGISYVSEKFNRTENHKNIAIGSTLNGFVNLRLNANFHLSKNFRLESGFGLTHFSNGSFTIPNLGINLVTANLGIGYHFANSGRSVIKDSIPKAERKMHYNIIAIGALTEIEAAGGGKFSVYGLSLNALKTLNHKNALGAGLDVIYNNANLEKFRRDSITFSNNLVNTQLGLKFAYELTISKLSLPFEMGFYALTKYKGNGIIYHRLGTRYQVNKHLNVAILLKTHFAKADYLELGIGYKL